MVRTTSFLCSKLAASQGRRKFVATQTPLNSGIVCDNIDGETPSSHVTASGSKKRRMEYSLLYDESEEFIRTNCSIETPLPRQDLPQLNKFAKLAENTNPTNNSTPTPLNELSVVALSSSSLSDIDECEQKSPDLSRSVYIHDNGRKFVTWRVKRAITNAMESVGPDIDKVLLHLQLKSNLPLFITSEMLGYIWNQHVENTFAWIIPPTGHWGADKVAYVYFACGDKSLAAEMYHEEQTNRRLGWEVNKSQVSMIRQKFGWRYKSWVAENGKRGSSRISKCPSIRESLCFADLSQSVFATSTGKGRPTYLTWTAKRALTNAMELVGPDAYSVLKYLRDEHQFPLFVTRSMIQKVWKSHCLISVYERAPKLGSTSFNGKQSGSFNIFVRIAKGDTCLGLELMKIDHAQCVREFESNKRQVRRILEKFKSKIKCRE